MRGGLSLSSTSTRRVEEGYRVLTLQYPITEDIKEFIEEYRVLASHLYWCRRFGLEPTKEAIENLWQKVPSYWRWHLVDPKDPMYLFKGVEETSIPYRTIIRLPLIDALHERKEAYVKDGKLILRLNRRVELNIPEKVLRWFEKRLAERPDKKYVRVFERDNKLVVQIVLHKINRVEIPKDPLLIVVDVNSSYGIVVHFWDKKLIKTMKFRPPNRGNRWKYVRVLMSHRDLLYNQGCLTQKQINIYSTLVRLTLKGSVKGWVQQTVAKVVKRIRRMAKRHGKEPLVLIDKPGYESINGTPLQRTLYSFTRYLENLLSWYGVYWEEKRLYSTICPICGNKLISVEKTKRTRVLMCTDCGFRDDKDNIPLYWAIKDLPALKDKASNMRWYSVPPHRNS
jgi:DNA-directed RNA polymerase subunit RPC12/RpoP